MKSSPPFQFGPWQTNENSEFLNKNNYKPHQQEKQKRVNQIKFPQISFSQEKHTKIKDKFQCTSNQLTLKVNKNSQRSFEMVAGNLGKSSAFMPPVISLHNKKHPKLRKKQESQKNKSNSIIQVDPKYMGKKLTENMNRIDFSAGSRNLKLSETIQLSKLSSGQRQLFKKKSLTELLRYLKKDKRVEIMKNLSLKQEKSFTRYAQSQAYGYQQEQQ